LPIAIAATCTTPGSTGDGTCTRCSEAVTGTVIDALGHNWKWETYVSGNGVNGGIRTCQRGNGCTVKAGIGDTGPAGGKIFYAAEFDFYDGNVPTTVKRYYLEAAPNDLAETYIWQRYFNNIAGTGTGIGTGCKNTALIHAHTDTTPAASACVAPYNAGGAKNDWFLPSKDELNQMYQNLVKDKTGHGFSTSRYFWSSSQINYVDVWLQYFDDGAQYEMGKNYSNAYVRAIRAF